MNLLDTRTVILVYAISNLICMIVIAFLWRQNRKRFSGICFWLADFVLQFLGLLLVLLRGNVPDFLSMTVSNAFIIGGTILLYIGLEHFTGKRTHQIHNYILLVAFVVIHAYFVYFLPSLAFRNILFSLGLLIICAQCAWLILRRVGVEMRLITRGVGYVFIIFCLVSLVRIFVTIFAPPENNFFHSNTYDTLLLVTYQMLFIILTFSLSLLVNRHLFVDLKKEFLVRSQTERALSERAKELKCIYDLSNLIQTSGISLDEILSGSVRLLPPAMSYPEFARARLVVWGQSYATENFQDSASKISCEILESRLKIGMLEVCYPKEPPLARDDLFLKEEITLLHDVASRLGRVIERQAFNDAVKKSQESYQVFIHQSFEAIYRTEFDQPIDISLPVETQIDLIYANAYMAECNQAMANMYNLPSVDALIGTRLLDAHGSSDNPINRAAFRKFIEGGYKSTNDETLERDAQGNPVWFLSNTLGIVDNGLLVRMWGTSINITDRKQAEEALRRREREFKTLVENSPDAITRFDREGHYQFVNPARAWYFGRSVDEIQGRTIWDLIGPDEVEEGKLSDEALKRVFENPKDYTVEYQTKTPAGMRWVQSRGTPEFAEDGSVESVLVITRDITERKETEEALKQSEMLLREIAANYPHSFVSVIEKDLTVGFTAGQEFRRLNLDPDSFVGLTLDQVFGEHAPLVRENYLKTFEGAEAEFELSINNQHQLYRTVPLVNRDGKIDRILSVAENITERKQAQAALMQAKRQAEESEVRFRQSLEFSPVPIAVADSKGRLTFLNKQFIDTYGYTLQDIPTMSQWYVLAYPDSEYRAVLLKEWETDVEYAAKNNVPTPVREYRVVCKTDEIKTVEISAYFEGDLAIGLFRDVSDRKYTEGITQLRLQLWEFSASHSVEELMQKALDEIGNITDSPIGFYHFVEEDQNTLSLQAWSTRTLAEFCKAEGRDLHYPISEAGVWVDCVRERKPVIHDNYASLPHRKGLPAGHAEVLRELVVPTMRNNQVVAILGIGNKPTHYDDKDVGLVSHIADIIWTIVEQKQADEQIRQLNAKLEQLAMTDELTGIFNRRSFFKRGAEEIRRSQRYGSPLSLLMLDIDAFKLVNDTYGHDAGDRMLRCIADTLHQSLRDIDMLARLGGEEFGVLLPNTESGDAVKLAERLRLATEQATCSFQDQAKGVTLSIGVATFSKEIQNIDLLLKNADIAMYQSKNQGRNRVTVYK